ncbi:MULTISPECIES: TonB-dependent hemoglobin/transferrin/lactoferrin family receptor [unclassified Mesorhizobium]|uniref:TonB-dependent hemoglobin/transferrin/lactoferrin family receptor n=1 Tax=unclassified Mesorhizobium TaxID=325217 RepID=UPI00086B82CB|nr:MULTISPECIES: TonB-dependent hemoglobin/transferrin/lactoferrin family receptor [unclassified Mesorhizobium]MBN9255150.1 TonB-dependent hemoglobin/transferrin/lactoferrin family receptor [Mesorhizobium sp.]ODT19504.1 MAG: ligand-gated channel [Mesorhizobium sp. SCN 65-12]OJX82724.1 MAG: ligand-gated channel [Mesorhizobium sp. 65-26]
MGLANWARGDRTDCVPASCLALNGVALLAGVAAIALIASPASAQQAKPAQDQQAEQAKPKEEKAADGATLLDKILILSRTGETAIQSLASVSHVDQEQLDRRMATTPNDVFFGVPGITMQSDARRVASSVNIRGLQDFGRVQVIVDGARQDFQRSGHGTQSTFYIDPELLKSADVVRGPVANTYGSGAIGGVVFFETKDAADFLRDGETWAASATARYETNGKGWTTSASGAYRMNENWDVLGNIVYRDYGNYKDGGGNTVNGSGFDVLSGLIKTTIRPTENSELKLGWNGTSDNWQEVSSGVPAYDVGLKQNTFTARYNITDDAKSWLDLHINASYGKTSLNQTSLIPLNRYDPSTGGAITVPAGSVSAYDMGTLSLDIWNTSRFETGALAHELTYGGDWVSDDVKNVGPSGSDSFYTPSGKRRVSGAYVQDKISWEWLEVVAGLRYDSYSLKSDANDTSGDRLSPRITVGISPFESAGLEGLQFYTTYAEGYRSPSITETLISGLHPAGVVFPFLPNPNLKPETGKTWEAGVNYKTNGVFQPDDALRIKAAYFHNDVDDYIGLNDDVGVGNNGCPYLPGLPPIWVPGGYYIPTCAQYQNYANAKIQGFEFESVYEAAWGFAGLSASVTNGHTVSYAGVREDLSTIPSSQVSAQLGFRFLEDKLTVGGEVQYNGKPKGNAIARDYTLVNAFASYQATDNLKIDFRADNLFDVKYVNPLNGSTTSPIYEPGVTLKLAATMRFGG